MALVLLLISAGIQQAQGHSGAFSHGSLLRFVLDCHVGAEASAGFQVAYGAHVSVVDGLINSFVRQHIQVHLRAFVGFGCMFLQLNCKGIICPLCHIRCNHWLSI